MIRYLQGSFCSVMATLLLAIACGGRTRHLPAGSGGAAGGGGADRGGASGTAGATGGVSGGPSAAGGESSKAGSSGAESGAGTDGAAGSGAAGNGAAGSGAAGNGAAGNGAAGNGAGAAGLGGGGTAGMAGRDTDWATWPMPNPVSSGLPNPHSYTELDDGTVQDNVTGLVWQKFATSPESSGDWEAAQRACELFDGGWRLPSIIELVSLVDVTSSSVYDPIFGRLASVNVWSSTEGTEDSTRAWSTYGGATYPLLKTTELRPGVCVRAGSTRTGPHYESVAASAVPAVRDNFTGLVWQQGLSQSKLPFLEVASYCDGLGDGFRAPSAKELYSLVDRQSNAPTIDETYFPNTPSEHFWSGDPYNGDIAWVVGFDLGQLATYRDAANWVRCVR